MAERPGCEAAKEWTWRGRSSLGSKQKRTRCWRADLVGGHERQSVSVCGGVDDQSTVLWIGNNPTLPFHERRSNVSTRGMAAAVDMSMPPPSLKSGPHLPFAPSPGHTDPTVSGVPLDFAGGPRGICWSRIGPADQGRLAGVFARLACPLSNSRLAVGVNPPNVPPPPPPHACRALDSSKPRGSRPGIRQARRTMVCLVFCVCDGHWTGKIPHVAASPASRLC